eukprot:4509680-Amphidinium_carterae.1
MCEQFGIPGDLYRVPPTQIIVPCKAIVKDALPTKQKAYGNRGQIIEAAQPTRHPSTPVILHGPMAYVAEIYKREQGQCCTVHTIKD